MEARIMTTTAMTYKQYREMVKPVRKKPMTNTNALTAAVIKYLSAKGFKVWRSNNIAAPNRRFTGLLGVPDVIGFQISTGRFIGVEVKSKKDSLSLAQVEFGINALEGGAMWFVVKEIKNFIYQIDVAEKNDLGFNNYQLRRLREVRHDLLIHKRKKKAS